MPTPRKIFKITSMSRESGQQPVIDERLYSRQLFAIGVEAMKRLTTASVLISGMGGLGVEVAKNLFLAGVQSVTIHDDRVAQLSDLASNFYLSETSIGKNRAIASYPQLTTLNSYVSVSATDENLTESFLWGFQCVVLADRRPESEVRRISQFCHDQAIKFILGETQGLFGYVFVDSISHDVFFLGTEASLPDLPPGGTGLGTVTDDDDHDVDGGAQQKPKADKFERENIKFLSLVDSLNSSDSFHQAFDTAFDEGAEGRDQQVVIAFIAAQRILENKCADSNVVTYEDLLTAVKELNDERQLVEEIDEDLMREFARESGAVIGPTCAALGGIVGHEVVKALSGKFTPLHQFLGIGYIEALPRSPITYEPVNDRYDPFRQVFGNEQQEVMQNLRYFMIGAGAIGCEQLKNWALMGVATKGDGRVWVTDMDQIERSNLNRQFLFHDSDIGKMKSQIAAKAVQAMNREMRIEAQSNRLGPESVQIYHDRFYESLSGVCDALDNVEARLFSDRQCVRHHLPRNQNRMMLHIQNLMYEAGQARRYVLDL
jgi:ubiquitin-activating enzyme E1